MSEEVETPETETAPEEPVVTPVAEIKTKPKTPAPKPKATVPPVTVDTDSLPLPEIKIKEEIIADFTPMGWLLFGCVIAAVIGYTWYKQRKASGKGMLPDGVQERMRPRIAEQ